MSAITFDMYACTHAEKKMKTNRIRNKQTSNSRFPAKTTAIESLLILTGFYCKF